MTGCGRQADYDRLPTERRYTTRSRSHFQKAMRGIDRHEMRVEKENAAVKFAAAFKFGSDTALKKSRAFVARKVAQT